MKWAQFEAMLVLHWCLLRNRIRRIGIGTGALTVILLVLGTLAMIFVFALTFELGVDLFPKASPFVLLLAWCGIAGGFLFSWTLGLLMALQRSDGMALTKFLHLPAPLGWVLVYNYLCSYVSFSMAICLPAMLGLSLALVRVHGPTLLAAFPLVFAFIAMVTALTYQFRGWLERLMRNKRRRQYVIVGLTFLFVAVAQLPNLFNLTRLSSDRKPEGELGALSEEREGIHEELRALLEESKQAQGSSREKESEASESLAPEGVGRVKQLRERLKEIKGDEDRLEKGEKKAKLASIERVVTPVARWVPLGWLPYGMRAALEREVLPCLLCILGMLGIALWSLRRSYHSTIVFLTGGTSKRAVASPAIGAQRRKDRASNKPLLVSKDVPWISEGQASVGLTALQGMIRMPELKLLLLGPVIFIGVGSFWAFRRAESLQEFAPYLGLVAITMGLISVIQLVQNQFGLDRDGFRAYVLCPVPRHEILRGKNLAAAPASLGIGGIALIVLQILIPMDVGHFLAACLQLLTAYMILCMFGNFISIVAPVRLLEHSMRAAKMTAGVFLSQIACLVLFPLALTPLLLPFVGETLAVSFLGFPAGGLVCLALSLALLATMGWLYLLVTRGQGEMLQQNEQKILEKLTRQ